MLLLGGDTRLQYGTPLAILFVGLIILLLFRKHMMKLYESWKVTAWTAKGKEVETNIQDDDDDDDIDAFDDEDDDEDDDGDGYPAGDHDIPKVLIDDAAVYGSVIDDSTACGGPLRVFVPIESDDQHVELITVPLDATMTTTTTMMANDDRTTPQQQQHQQQQPHGDGVGSTKTSPEKNHPTKPNNIDNHNTKSNATEQQPSSSTVDASDADLIKPLVTIHLSDDHTKVSSPTSVPPLGLLSPPRRAFAILTPNPSSFESPPPSGDAADVSSDPLDSPPVDARIESLTPGTATWSPIKQGRRATSEKK